MTSTIREPIVGRDSRDAHTNKRPRLQRRLAGLPQTSDKLRVPIPSVPLLRRHRVTTLIRRATASRVAVVTGPTGAGKTIACAIWADDTVRRARGDIAWVGLDPGDRQPARLWTNIGAALTGSASAADLVTELPDPADQVFPLRLAEVARQLQAPVTVVLDDMQELA